jgi:threonine dehydratase
MEHDVAIWGTEGAEPDMRLADAVTIDDVRAAGERIRGVAIRTPALRLPALDDAAGAEVVLKCENLQPIGAFKIRGATNAMAMLSDEQRDRGVITYSSGNHAQGIAYAAARLGVSAVVVMPQNAPRVKLQRTRAFLADAPPGSEVIEYNPHAQQRERLGRRLAEERGLTLIPPYDHPDVIAGQGTAALELLEDAGDLDRLFVCCGGGGLLGGSSIIAKSVSPRCEVIGVEPANADDAARSLRSGRLHVNHNPPTIADGTRTPFLGRYTFPIIRRFTDGIVTVSEAEIARATLFCLETLRLVVEPSGALGVAGAIAHARPGTRVGVIISGGNLDMDAVPELRRIADAAE